MTGVSLADKNWKLYKRLDEDFDQKWNFFPCYVKDARRYSLGLWLPCVTQSPAADVDKPGTGRQGVHVS